MSWAYSAEQLAFLRQYYVSMPLPQLTAAFNAHFNGDKKASHIRACLNNHKIQSGRTGHFEDGSVPFNKGTKGLMKANKTSFKKGNVPNNERPMGFERLSKDGYIEIKVPGINKHTGYEGHFELKHKYLWEQTHGPVPEGMAVTFIDGNKSNICMDNLELISRAELLHLNHHGIKDLPAELLPAMRAVARLEVATYKKSSEVEA